MNKKKNFKRWIASHVLILGMLAFGSVIARPGHAETSVQEIRMIARALNFVRGIETADDTIRIGIFYDPSQPDSLADFKNIKEQLDKGLESKKGRLQAVPVALDKMPGLAKKINIAYITPGLDAHFEKIREFTRQNHLLTISSDMACARAGCCVLTVKSDGGVNIFLNQEAMQLVGVDFDAAFKFMVKRL